MYETEIQKRVSIPIIDKEVDKIRATLSENHGTVIVEVQHEDGRTRDAAYTAEDARKLARAIEIISDQQWGVDNSDLVDYLNILADIVDGKKTKDAAIGKEVTEITYD